MNPLVTVVKKFGSMLKLGDGDSPPDAESKTPRDSNKDVPKAGLAETVVPTNPTKLIQDLSECLDKIKVLMLNLV